MEDPSKLSKELLIEKVKLLQKELEFSKENLSKLHTIFENVDELITYIDKNGIVLNVNKKVESMLGYKPIEVIGENFASIGILQLKDLPQLIKLFKQSISGADFSKTRVLEIIHKKGKIIQVEISTNALKENGEIIGFVNIIKDITKEKEAGQAVAESEELYKSLFFNNHSIMLIINPNNGSIVDANPAALKFYGWTLTHIKSMRIDQINHLSKKQVALEMNNAKLKIKNHFYFKHQLANNEIKDVEVYSGPIVVKGKELLYSIIHDITEHNKTLIELKESEIKFRLLADYTYDWEYWLDQNGNFIYISPSCERITGYSPEHFRNNPNLLYQITKKEYKEAVKKHYKDENNRNSPIFKMIFSILTKNNEERWIEHNCNPVFDDKGNYRGRRGNNRDITEKYIANQNLQNEKELLQSLFDTIPVMITMYKPSINDFSVNREFEKCIGYSNKEVQKIDLMKKCYPNPEYREKAAVFMKSLTPQWMDFEIITKSGNKIFTSWRNLLLSDKTQIGIGIDITLKKHNQKIIAESEAKLKSIFRASPIGIGVVKNRIFEFVNHRFTEICGYSAEELIHKSAEIIYPSKKEYDFVGKVKYDQINEYGTGTVETRFKHKNGRKNN